MFDMLNDPAETTNLLFQCQDKEIWERCKRLRATLISYEQRYGLEGYIKDGNFIELPTYQIQPYYETNFPSFVNSLDENETAELNRYDDEILNAIKKEPTVKLRYNHTKEILSVWGGYSEEKIERILAKAEAQGN